MTTPISGTIHAPARGKVLSAQDKLIVFQPSGTSYELHLATPAGKYAGPLNAVVEGVIRAAARKIWTVPSGGNWLEPLSGSPRIAQGRVRDLDDTSIVLSAGVNILITLPSENSAIDLNSGALGIGRMINATLLPGASFEWVSRGGPKQDS